MSDIRSAAARNNAQWCDLVARTHGIDARFADDAWTSGTRTPLFYPDAVTLVPDLSVPELLERIDTRPGCSIKDSFAALDLRAFGFRPLFDAQWIMRLPHLRAATPAGNATHWQAMAESGFTTLTQYENDEIVGGAILSEAGGVVGLSNFLTTTADESDAWTGCLALADALFPQTTFVGYESGDALAAACDAGFTTAGSLRIWTNES